jgi:hypothetical protein
MPYDLEIVIRRDSATPFRVPEIGEEARVQEIAHNYLAAWGIRVPDGLRDNGKSSFAERLAEAGEYRHDEQDYTVIVKAVA